MVTLAKGVRTERRRSRPRPEPDWSRSYRQQIRLIDLAAVSVALGAALIMRFGSDPSVRVRGSGNPFASYLVLSAVLGGSWMLLLAAHRSYDRAVLDVGPDEYRRVLMASGQLWGIVAVISYVGNLQIARGFVAIAFPLGTVLLLLGRRRSRAWLGGIRNRTTSWSHQVLVVGQRSRIVELLGELRREPRAGLHVVGACISGEEVGQETLPVAGVPVLGSLDSVMGCIESSGADTVAVTASSGLTSSTLKRLGWGLEGRGIDLVVAPALTDVAGPRVHIRPVAGLPLLHVEQPVFTGTRLLVKQTFDRVSAFLGLLLLSPLLIAVAIAVRTTSHGPAFFRQVRIGQEGRCFHVVKFRTMVVDAEQRFAEVAGSNETDGLLFKLKADPRITRIGNMLRRYSIDELPQLINVVRGEMSLVGPRPLPVNDEDFQGDVRRRLLVRPGITGLWQVSGRSDLSWEDSVRLDLYYVENWSFTGDLMILWRTVAAVARSAGAY